MKYVTLTAFALFAAHVSYGQKTEYSVHLNSGGFGYRGSGAASTSSVLVPDTYPGNIYTNSPYGKYLGLSYGLGGQVQRTTPKHNLFGVQAGYEVLRSRVDIVEITGGFGLTGPASGHTTRISKAINLYPFFGHRLAYKAIDFDLTAGPEFGLVRSTQENIEATLQGKKISVNNTRIDSYLDLRARLNLTAYYKHVGLSAGYSKGFTNGYGSYDGSEKEAYAQFFRLGLAYRL